MEILTEATYTFDCFPVQRFEKKLFLPGSGYNHGKPCADLDEDVVEVMAISSEVQTERGFREDKHFTTGTEVRKQRQTEAQIGDG